MHNKVVRMSIVSGANLNFMKMVFVVTYFLLDDGGGTMQPDIGCIIQSWRRLFNNAIQSGELFGRAV